MFSLALCLLPGNLFSTFFQDMEKAYVEEASPSPLVTYALCLGPGEEIMSTLLDFVEKHKLGAAFILTCVGSVTKARLRMADSVSIKDYDNVGQLEIVSLVGTLSAGAHIHGSFSDSQGQVIGGHVIGNLVVYTTAEIVIGECKSLSFTREFDEKSGYPELVVADRKMN